VIGPVRSDRVRHRPTIAPVRQRGIRIGNGHPSPLVGDAAVVKLVLVRFVRRRRAEIRRMEAQDVEDIGVVDPPAGIGHGFGDPLRLGVTLDVADIDLATSGVGHDEPDQAGPDDETDDQQPPVELGVHFGRVSGTASVRPVAASTLGG